MDIPPQDVITKDNVPVRVNAVTYFNVVDPVRSVVAIENHVVGTSQIAQTTLRSILGQVDLDELLIKREEINQPRVGDASLSGRRALRNADRGIVAVAGAIDGGRNIAAGNGSTPQRPRRGVQATCETQHRSVRFRVTEGAGSWTGHS